MKRKRCLLLIVMLMAVMALPLTAHAKVKINKKKASIYVGKTVQLKITGTKKKVKWSSNRKKIATVSSKGKVTGKSAGSATITAKVGKKKYKCVLTVKNPNSTSTSSTTGSGRTFDAQAAYNSCAKTTFDVNSMVVVRFEDRYSIPMNIAATCVFYNGNTPVDSKMDFLNHMEYGHTAFFCFRYPDVDFTRTMVTYDLNDARYLDGKGSLVNSLSASWNIVRTEYDTYAMITVNNSSSVKCDIGEISIVYYSGGKIIDVSREYIETGAHSSQVIKASSPYNKITYSSLDFDRCEVFISSAYS